jgi:hypothetical protein
VFSRKLDGGTYVVRRPRDENAMRHHLVHARICRVEEARHVVGSDFAIDASFEFREEV